MAIVQDIGPVYRGEDVTITFTMTPTTDISGWTIAGTFRQAPQQGPVLFTVAGSVTSAVAGIFTLSIAAATTASLPANLYAYDVWRTDSGSAANLSTGLMRVLGSSRVP